MCGFAGIFNWDADKNEWIETLEDMSKALYHRGPDDNGLWLDEALSVGMIHQRLSILDLSPNGHQPMISHSKNLIIAFNGEIYNFKDLKSDLEKRGSFFKGHSDTEVLLEAIEIWGLSATLEKCHGMFAFSLFDRNNRKLFLVRDRFGEKPLYWCKVKDTLLFASELHALKRFPEFNGSISEKSLELYKRFGHFPGEATIFENVFKLLPGNILSISKNENPKIENYYSLSSFISSRSIQNIDLKSAADELELRLEKIISRQLITDVQVGCFLSSGVDSSLISAIAQKCSSKKIKTFSAGFIESTFDESKQAKKIADHLGTEHTELVVSESEALQIIPELGKIYDEPFADSSQIPTILLSKLIRKHVTVALSGDAGDEVFGGYNRYKFFNQFWPPSSIQQIISSKFNRSNFLKNFSSYLLNSRRSESLNKFLVASEAKSLESAYASVTEFNIGQQILPASYFSPSMNLSSVENIIFWDQTNYLPNDILVKVDRAAMSQSLETRIPFLDHSLVEWSWTLPKKLKIDGINSKIISRELQKKYLPSNLLSNSKKGFAIPLNKWMKGPLFEMIDASFQKASSLFLDQKDLKNRWNAFLNGEDRLRDYLWAAFIFELWMKNFKSQ